MYQELPETDFCVFGNLLGIGVRPVTGGLFIFERTHMRYTRVVD
jgi:hypothetical protein